MNRKSGMLAFKRFLNLRGVLLVSGFIVLVYLAQVAFAQDDSTTVPADPEVTAQAAFTDAQTTPTSIAPTDEPSQPAPTEVLVTLQPTETDQSASPTPVTPDQPTIEPTIALPDSVTLSTDNTTFALNSTFSVKVTAKNVSDVYSMALLCQVDPTHLHGMQAAAGDLLPEAQTTLLDNGFQANGQWVIIAAQHDDAPALQPAGTLMVLNYQVVAAGATQVTCQIQLAGHNSQPLPLDNAPITLAINGFQQGNVPTAVIPTAVIPATVAAPTNPVIIATVVPTAIPSATVYHLQGYISSPFALANMAITLTGTSGTQTASLQADNSFAFDLPAGTYQLKITAQYYVPYLATVTIIDQPILLPLIKLHAGDVDGNGVVDNRDVAVVVADFGLTSPDAANYPDLNGDGVINIYDLSIVSAGLRN